jgi:hypothetical protein
MSKDRNISQFFNLAKIYNKDRKTLRDYWVHGNPQKVYNRELPRISFMAVNSRAVFVEID